MSLYFEQPRESLSLPEQIRRKLAGYKLEGRRITGLKLLGYSYAQSETNIEEIADDPNALFWRCACVDEPLLIQFDDGSVFDIDTPQEPEFNFGLDRAVWQAESHWGPTNVDASSLFSPCVGRTVVSVEVKTYTTSKRPMYGCSFDEPPYTRELASHISFLLENGYTLRIGPRIDFCEIECIGPDGEVEMISQDELQRALK